MEKNSKECNMVTIQKELVYALYTIKKLSMFVKRVNNVAMSWMWRLCRDRPQSIRKCKCTARFVVSSVILCILNPVNYGSSVQCTVDYVMSTYCLNVQHLSMSVSSAGHVSSNLCLQL